GNDAYGRTAEAIAGSHRTVAEDESGTGRKGATAGGTESGSRDQEQGSGAGQGGARREGRAVGPHFEIQEPVPGEDEPRTADAAEQPADPGEDASGKPGEESQFEAGELRGDDSHFRNGPAGADQRHSGSQQNRIREDGCGSRQCAVQRVARLLRAH